MFWGESLVCQNAHTLQNCFIWAVINQFNTADDLFIFDAWVKRKLAWLTESVGMWAGCDKLFSLWETGCVQRDQQSQAGNHQFDNSIKVMLSVCTNYKQTLVSILGFSVHTRAPYVAQTTNEQIFSSDTKHDIFWGPLPFSKTIRNSTLPRKQASLGFGFSVGSNGIWLSLTTWTPIQSYLSPQDQAKF